MTHDMRYRPQFRSPCTRCIRLGLISSSLYRPSRIPWLYVRSSLLFHVLFQPLPLVPRRFLIRAGAMLLQLLRPIAFSIFLIQNLHFSIVLSIAPQHGTLPAPPHGLICSYRESLQAASRDIPKTIPTIYLHNSNRSVAFGIKSISS